MRRVSRVRQDCLCMKIFFRRVDYELGSNHGYLVLYQLYWTCHWINCLLMFLFFCIFLLMGRMYNRT